MAFFAFLVVRNTLARAMSDPWAIIIANLEPKVTRETLVTASEAHVAMNNAHHDIASLRELARPHDEDDYAYEAALELYEVVQEEVGPRYSYLTDLLKTMARIQVTAYMASRISINTSVRKLIDRARSELDQYFHEVKRLTT